MWHTTIQIENVLKQRNVLMQISSTNRQTARPRGYKTSFMINSTEHEIYHAPKC